MEQELKAILMLVLALASSSAAADGRRLYAACAACHGTNGAGQGDALHILAGRPRSKLVESMRAFKDGAQPSTVMQQIAKGFTDSEIEEIAAFLERQPLAQRPAPKAK